MLYNFWAVNTSHTICVRFVLWFWPLFTVSPPLLASFAHFSPKQLSLIYAPLPPVLELFSTEMWFCENLGKFWRNCI